MKANISSISKSQSCPLQASRRPVVVCRAEVRARWCLDVRFGRKAEGTSLLQEWVRDVGMPAGLTTQNTRLSSGSIGVPESRLELEVTFPSTSDWERFLGSVSAKEHKAWSQRVQSMVVDGSPAWHVYRMVPLEVEGEELPKRQEALDVAPPPPPARARVQQTQQPTQQELDKKLSASFLEQFKFDDLLQDELSNRRRPGEGQKTLQLPQLPQLPSGSAGGDLEKALRDEGVLDVKPGEDVDVVLDWKGDPMVIKPGDRMPKWL